MSIGDLVNLFKQEHDGEYLKFERVAAPLSARRDLHAFLLLEQLRPSAKPIIGSAVHDEFFLEVDPAALAAVITFEQVRDLIRCGVLYDAETDSFSMFA